VTARSGAPGKGAGAQTTGDLDAGTVETLGGDYDRSIVDDPLPLYRSPEFDALDPDDPRRWQSTVRAADAWFSEGQPDVIRERLLADIAFNDGFTAHRLRMVSNDLSAAQDWRAASHRRMWAELERLRRYEPEAS
jgi:hypothetical protein